MNRLICFVVALSGLLLSSCGGGGGTSDVASSVAASQVPATIIVAPSASLTLPIALIGPSGYPGDAANCSVATQKRWLDDYMSDQYFWSTSRPLANASAATVDDYFQSQLFVPTDRYSYSQELAAFTQFFVEGTRTGYGYSLAFADGSQGRLQVRTVEPLGPAAAAGLQRGDTVLSIDGFSPANIVNGSLTTVVTAGIRRVFNIENSVGERRTVTMVSRNFLLSPVLTDKVLTAANGAKVGYLVYQEFTDLSLPALGAAFNRFRSAGVSELIVDLRYNGGGSVTVARALASMIGGTALEGKTFASIRFNAQNNASDFDYPFTASLEFLPAAPLEGLTKVVFITSPNTASASELVINALFPFKKVVTIGASTFGKPYGFQPRSSCDTVFNAVNFETFNALGAGRFSSGLPATCSVSDDLSKALGDPAERRTAAALGYIQTNACPASSDAAGRDLQAKSRDTPPFSNPLAITSAERPRPSEPAFGEVRQPGMFID